MNETFEKLSEKSIDFLRGMASSLDMGATIPLDVDSLYASPEDADRYALAKDWYEVGNDLKLAMDALFFVLIRTIA